MCKCDLSLAERCLSLICECKITTFPSPPQYSKVMLFLSKNHITHPHN